MPDPLNQVFQWTVTLVDQFAVPLAIAVGAYWLWLLVRRATVSSADPSYRKSTSSGIGGVVFVASGAYLSAMIAGILLLVTWPAPIETPALGALIVGGVVFHAVLEKREDFQEG